MPVLPEEVLIPIRARWSIATIGGGSGGTGQPFVWHAGAVSELHRGRVRDLTAPRSTPADDVVIAMGAAGCRLRRVPSRAGLARSPDRVCLDRAAPPTGDWMAPLSTGPA